MAKLSPEQKSQISDMAEKMAGSTFKANPNFKGNRKSQIFAITTNRVKNAKRK